MKKSSQARASIVALVLFGVAVFHCGGTETSTPPSGSAGSSIASTTAASTTGSTTGSTTRGAGGAASGTTAGTGAAGSGTAGTASGGSAGGGGTGIGGTNGLPAFDGSFGDCPVMRPAQGAACPSPIAVCQYGSIICACGNGRTFACLDLEGGLTFDATIPRRDASLPAFDAGRGD